MKKLENAVIIKLNDNTYRDENDYIVSINLRYEDNSVQTTRPYRASYHSFMTALIDLLQVDGKQEIEGKKVMVCTGWQDKIFAIGNQEGTKWIESDPQEVRDGDKQIFKVNVVDGDIIKYLEEKEKSQELDR